MYDDELGVLAFSCQLWVVGEYSIPKFLKPEEDVPQRCVVCKELDLAGAVEEDIVVYQILTYLPSLLRVLRTPEFLQAFF